jgi:hypothetical protein
MRLSSTDNHSNENGKSNVDHGSIPSSRIFNGGDKESSVAGQHHAAVATVGAVVKRLSVTMALCSALVLSPFGGNQQQQNNVAFAYSDTDYASETVQTTIKALKDAAGDAAATFKAYETLADIITEGSGLGGSVNFQGVTVRACVFAAGLVSH